MLLSCNIFGKAFDIIFEIILDRRNFLRACLITLHSNFEIFQEGHPVVEFMLDRRIFER